MDNITPKAISEALNIHYRKALDLLALGHIRAVKSKGNAGRWIVTAADFEAFKVRNNRKLDALRKKYVALYRGGVTVKALAERTPDDMAKKGIIYDDHKGFAEWTIYNFVMQEGKNNAQKQVS